MTDTTKALLEELANYLNFQDFLNEHCDLILAPTKNRGIFRAVSTELDINTLPIIGAIKLDGEEVTIASDGKYFIIMNSNTLADTIYLRRDFVQLVEFKFKDKVYQFPLEVLRTILEMQPELASDWVNSLKRV